MSSGKRIIGPIPPNILKRMRPEDRPAGVAGMLPEEIQDKVCAKAEKELQNKIMGWLEIQGIFAGRQRMDKKSNIRIGYPDIWFCWKAGGETHPMAIECKIASHKQTAEQVEAEQRMVKDGWLYLVITSLPELIESLKMLGERKTSQNQAGNGESKTVPTGLKQVI
jgi:hypothetical protein